ncbi:hypothetical protein, partial [Oenococcus oeni]
EFRGAIHLLIKVYTDQSIQSVATKKCLSNHHVDFKEIKAIGNKKVFDYLRKVKAKMLPYVETENDSWSGYRPDRLRKMIENKS